MNILKTIFCCLITVLLIVIPAFLIAQTKDDFEKKGDYYYKQCERLFNKNLDSTLYFIQLALENYEKANSWEKYLYSRNALATTRYRLGDYAAYQSLVKQAVEEAEKYLGETSVGMSASLSNYSICLREMGDHKKAIHYLERALKIEDDLKDDEARIVTLGNLGTNYFRMGDYSEALKYYFKVMAMSKENPGILSPDNQVNTCNKIGNAFFEKEELDSAKVYFRKCLTLLASQKPPLGDIARGHKINTNMDIAKVFLKQNESDSAHIYVSRAINLSTHQHYNYRARAYEILGKLFFQKKDYAQSISWFLQSKKITVDQFSAYQKHYSIAEKDILLAKAYQESGNALSALIHYQQALQMLSHDALSDDVFQVPRIKTVYSKLNFLEALKGKATTFFERYKQQANQKDLEAAYETFQVAVQLIQSIRQDYQQEGSLLQLSTSVLPIYEGAIASAIALNQRTGEESYLKAAYVFCESNKAILLLESINESMAKGFSGIPDALLEKEMDLRLKISFFNRKLNEDKNKIGGGNRKKQEGFNNQLFDLEQEYQNLIDTFEKEFPKYYQLKYSTQLATVEDVQKKLAHSSTALIEYFFGEKNIYIFSITANTISVKQSEKEKKLLDSIFKVRNFLNQAPQNQDVALGFKSYVQCAFDIFQKLLSTSIPPEVDHLIVVADDRLGYLPFEALLTDVPPSGQPLYSLDNLSYLLKAYEISYSYSGTLFINSFSESAGPYDEIFLGFAPSFDASEKSEQSRCNGQRLYNLNCNQKEVEDIKALLGGKVLAKESASKTVFGKEANHCQVLHLATHACLDDQNPNFSKIYLSDDYISNSDLYNLELNSEMVVLSACETGAGQLVKGEGVMSLARGFIHAGCPSVVMSLWSVDDCATADVMVGFYKNLKAGQTKSQAIRQAKLDYISQAKKAQQHPFYWAAFVQIGNYEPLEFSEASYFYPVIFILIATVLLVWIFGFRHNYFFGK